MNWNIRAMTAADVPQVAAMERACFSDPWPEQVLAKELENELSLWLVAVEGETVLGYIGSQTVLGEADMMNLAVGAEHRRQGIAGGAGQCAVCGAAGRKWRGAADARGARFQRGGHPPLCRARLY